MTSEGAVAPAGCRGHARRLLAAGVLVAAATGTPFAAAMPAVPTPSGRTVDQAELLSPATESALAAMLADLEAATGAQVAVLTIRSLEGEPIESFALRVAETWGLGSRARDDGVLLLVALEDRQARIEVGYGLEGALPDIAAGRIIREAMVPHFRRADFEAGVLEGARAIVERLTPGAAEPAAGVSRPDDAAWPVTPPRRIDWDLLWAWIIFLVAMPAVGLGLALLGEDGENRGIGFGGLLLPLMLGGSLVVDELAFFPPDSGKFLLGGVALLAIGSTLFWWGHFRLAARPGLRARWRSRADRFLGGGLLAEVAAKLGLPVEPRPGGTGRWWGPALMILLHLVIAACIAVYWLVGYGIFYLHNLFWLIVIYRAALYPSPSSDSSPSWSPRPARRAAASSPSPWRSSATSGGGFRPGGGSFGGGGASGSW